MRQEAIFTCSCVLGPYVTKASWLHCACPTDVYSCFRAQELETELIEGKPRTVEDGGFDGDVCIVDP
jgi:hypothetical protein